MNSLAELRQAALEIFETTRRTLDAGEAVRRAVKLHHTRLTILEDSFDLAAHDREIYAIAIGKAALPMAIALDDILREHLTAGVLARPQTEAVQASTSSTFPASHSPPHRWRMFSGGHPLPNQASLDAARASFELLRHANINRALVLFLISGGGSAIIEWPADESITLDDLRTANRLLVSCGATIADINSVRRAFSAIKGGALAAQAPEASQISLIISDTNTGEEHNVASGPTLPPPPGAPQATEVMNRYGLAAHLPASILRVINESKTAQDEKPSKALRKHHVLLDNHRAIQTAAEISRSKNFIVEIAHDVVEQHVAAGCTELLRRLFAMRRWANREHCIACLISGGEFACPLRGSGIGGRNSETALRWAIELDRWPTSRASGERALAHCVALSAGTDGIDGNSPAAGALADETTIARARALGLAPEKFLDESDAYTLFNLLVDALVTGPTGTNVRDLRIMLAG